MKKFFLLALLVCGVTATSFAQLVQSTTSVTERTYEKKKKKSFGSWETRYQGELNFGYATGGKLKTDWDGEVEKFKSNTSRPFIETIHGARIGDYLFVGAGAAVQFMYGELDPEVNDSPHWETMNIPVFLNLKGYYPVSDNFAPYVSLSLGGQIVALTNIDDYGGGDYGYSWEEKLTGGFYCDFGVGFNYKKFNFGLGMMNQTWKLKWMENGSEIEDESEKWSVTSFYVKLGLKF